MKTLKCFLMPRGSSVMLFGLVLLNKHEALTPVGLNHEHIHIKQFWEVSNSTLPIIFLLLWFDFPAWVVFLYPSLYYLWYTLEWFIKSFHYRSIVVARKEVSFEREAFKYEATLDYFEFRRPYSFVKYIKPVS